MHMTLHVGLGMLAGSALAVPLALRAYRAGRRPATIFAYWLLASYAGGVWAVFPSLLRRLGAPGAWCDGWWMNLFLGYAWLNRVCRGGMLKGALLICAVFTIQYVAMLVCLVRVRYRIRRAEVASGRRP